jgi:hypothetical protein
MINNKRLTTLVALTFLTTPALAWGADSYVSAEQHTTVLGTTMGGEQAGGNPAATQTLESKTNLTVFSHTLNAMTATAEPPENIGGVTYNVIYSFGKRIFSQAFYFGTPAPNTVTVGLAPTEVRVPFFVYPVVGPLTVEASGGVRFQANLTAQLTPEIGIPIQTSTLGVQLMALAQGAGFIEGDAQIPIILRVGVGGQVDLIDANFALNGRVSFDGNKPVVLFGGMIEFLKGRLYAFLDIFGIFNIGWKRLIDYDLYNWDGPCVAIGVGTCPAKK